MGALEDLALIDQIEKSATPEPLSTPEKILGYSRSYLAGPTFNFEDEGEAAIAAITRSLFNNKSVSQNYSDKLNEVRAQQERFKELTPYTDNATELVSSLILNPLGAVGNALKGAEKVGRGTKEALKYIPLKAGSPIARTVGTIGSSAPVQAALTSVGMTKGNENIVEDATKGALVGSALSAAGTVAGNLFEDVGLQANRFKLSAYGIGKADLNKQVRKLGSEGLVNVENDLPIVETLNKYEAKGLIKPGNDVIDNLKNVVSKQDSISSNLIGLLDAADSKLAPRVNFGLSNTLNYIEKLSGKAKVQAESAAIDEISALSQQLGRGTLRDLQQAKIGLNYKFDQNPYTDDIVKSLRSDLREEIENRVESLVGSGAIPKELSGAVRTLNQEWGNLAELRDVFASKAASKYGGNAIEDFFRAGATTGGQGSANIMSAVSGNPVYAAAGALFNAARGPESLSLLGDAARINPQALEAVGKVIPEVVTGRTSAQAFGPMTEPSRATSQIPTNNITDMQRYLDIIDQYDQGKKKMSEQDPLAAIKADPYAHAVALTESGMNPLAKNPESSASGLFQFVKGTANLVGLDDPFDVPKSLAAFNRLTESNAKVIKSTDPVQLYMAHYLGATVYNKLKNKKPLNDDERAQVEHLLTKALPAFEENYKLVTKA